MSDQFEPQEASVLLNFLNRVEIKGHVERNSMNILFAKLQTILNPPPPADGDGDSEIPPENEDTTDGEQEEGNSTDAET